MTAYTSLTAAPRRLHVLTAHGDIHRVHAFAVTAHGDIEPVVVGRAAYPVRHPVRMGNWLSCHWARVRGAHRLKSEPIEHLDEVTKARGPVPAAIVPMPSVIPNHRRPKTARTDPGKDNT